MFAAADKAAMIPNLDPEAVRHGLGPLKCLGIARCFNPVSPRDPASTIEAINPVHFQSLRPPRRPGQRWVKTGPPARS